MPPSERITAALASMHAGGFLGQRGRVLGECSNGTHTLRLVLYTFDCGSEVGYIEAEELPEHSDVPARIVELSTAVHLLQNVGADEIFQIGNREHAQT